MGPKKISFPVPKNVCRDFVTDKFCQREANGGCSYIHDIALLAEYREKLNAKKKQQASNRMKKRVAAPTHQATSPVVVPGTSEPTSTIAFQAPCPAVSQGGSTTTVTSKTAICALQPTSSSTTQDNSTSTITSKPLPPALQATGPWLVPNYMPQASIKNQTTTISIRSIRITASSTKATSTPNAVVATAPAPNKGRIQGRHCKFYLNGQHCPFQDRPTGCFDLHDLEARQANLAKRKLGNASRTQKQQTGPTPTSRLMALNDADPSSKLIQKIKDLTVTPAADSQSPVESAVETSLDLTLKKWDISRDWGSWAARYLGENTASDYIKPHLPALTNGAAPMHIFHVGLIKPTPAPCAATTFHYFPLLPFELRDQIWKHLLAEEKFDCQITYHFEFDRIGRHIEKKFKPENSAPRFLQVNSETRTLAMNFYEKAFATEDYPAACWFNFEADRLFVNPKDSKDYLEIAKNMRFKDRKRITRLAIPLKHIVRGNEKIIMEVIAGAFKNVEVITLIAGDSEDDAQWTRNNKLRAQIKKWNERLFLRVMKEKKTKRALPPPEIEFQLVAAHTAHHWKIDGFKW